MRLVSARARVFKAALILLAVIGSANQALAQYSDDLKAIALPRWWEIDGQMLFRPPTAIGDLGNIETVVDLRGFVPMELPVRPPNVLSDTPLRWFKIPTRKALLLLYFGSLRVGDIANDTTAAERASFSWTRFLKEAQVTGEAALWCKLAYETARDSEPLFERIAGSGFKAAEPTTVFLTEDTAFVILSFKYASILRITANTPDGQMLIGLEFSRSLKTYKTLYNLYSTTPFDKPTTKAFVESAPIVAKALNAAGIF
ncbi:MAG TPA: hypothetical protein VLY04_12615 [Bryobacteraceae bacterium]|nr:hypothetical protein [Bryobacteraceae bacterium]